LRTRSVDGLAEEWFPESEALTQFTAMHTALGSDHWRVVLEDFIGLFSHDHGEDFPDEAELAERRCCSFTATVILTLPRKLLVSCTASFPTPNFVFCRTQAIGHQGSNPESSTF
jgi:hypothetical protein